MNILLLTQVLPYPPDSGPKAKTWNVIKYLARHHDVTLVSFVRGNQDADAAHLKPYLKDIYLVPMKRSVVRDARALLTSLRTGMPWLICRDRRREMFDLLADLSLRETFDFIYADQLNMAQYAAGFPIGRKILDAHNALWLLYKRLVDQLKPGPMRWLYDRDWRLLKKYEGRICRSFYAITAVSSEDQAALEQAAGSRLNLVVSPISVDAQEVKPIDRAIDADHILHIGTMFWGPNVDGLLWFANEIFPLIKARRPNVVLDIVGARPPKSIRALAEEDPGINVTGYVPDPDAYLHQAGVLIVPLRAGGGMRVKILNALAQSIPVVTTTIGCEGIAVVHQRDVLIADTPQEFATATLTLLEDKALARQLGANGRRLIETTYDYTTACQPIDRIFNLQFN